MLRKRRSTARTYLGADAASAARASSGFSVGGGRGYDDDGKHL